MRAEAFPEDHRTTKSMQIGDIVTRYLDLPADTSFDTARENLRAEVNALNAGNPTAIDQLLTEQRIRLENIDAALGAYQAISGVPYQQ